MDRRTKIKYALKIQEPSRKGVHAYVYQFN